MGKSLFKKLYVSEERTKELDIPGLLVVSENDKDNTKFRTYHTVHKSYFSKEKVECPYCGKNNTSETKIVPRIFKDIIYQSEDNHKVIDLIFHQRYYRCKECIRIFSEKIDFAEDGCRYSNRLSDILAEETLTHTYEKVCKAYGVPASKASVGIIMRRRLKLKKDNLPPLDTPKALVIFVAYYHSSSSYPIILGIYENEIRLIDILSESNESTYTEFFNSLDRNKIQAVFIDPDEQLHAAVAAKFPSAKIMISEECIKRYLRHGLYEVIKKEGTRCHIYLRYHTLSMRERYLQDNEKRNVDRVLSKRKRLGAAYDAYQDIFDKLDRPWDIETITAWLEELPDYINSAAHTNEQLEELHEFDDVRDILSLYETQIKEFLSWNRKPPVEMDNMILGILNSLEEMPFCIYDVLHARMLLNVEQDYIIRDGVQYRTGVPGARLIEKMKEISHQIMSEKEIEKLWIHPKSLAR